jgi:ABC-2 type transport system permease protein
MNKILLVARREFLSRVQKRTFLLTTILLPIVIFGFYAMLFYFQIHAGNKTRLAVADEANIFKGQLDSNNEISFAFLKNETPASLALKLNNKDYDAYLYVPASDTIAGKDSFKIVSAKKTGLITRGSIQGIINNRLQREKLLSFHISPEQLDSAKKDSKIAFSILNSKEDDTDTKEQAILIIGYIFGFLIYIILFIYGTMVMRGVMEEKMNRIAEVIVSSVKPFQLMMGKITGIGAVGLLQFIIWIVIVVSTRLLLIVIFPESMGHVQGAEALKHAASDPTIMDGFNQINWVVLLSCFIFYFLGGYLLYSALFAAVGCAVNEDPQEAQSLILPIIMPIIFSIVILTKAVNDPNGSLAVFGSLFPLTSPIVMMARIAHGVPEGVPYWQLFASMLLLIGGFLGTTWMAGKIYRTGILMYGKKTTWKEMMKWTFKKN